MHKAFIVIISLFLLQSGQAATLPAKKILSISVTASGDIYMWPDTLTVTSVADEVQERLWKSYLGQGKMYDQINISYEAGVSEKLKTDVLKVIKEGQSKALTEVCLQKNKKRYDQLSSRQQRKIRKQFPVLFQEF